MTIAGTLSVTASDDPRFKAGDSIGIVLDPSVVITVTQNIDVTAPVLAPSTAPVVPATADEVAGEVDTTAEGTESPTAPATA